jgi:hypothetical protein|tara:strand:+ start:714 stop:893 length:180 start_codon:yes stop_codon:yes gene_type:complete
MTITSKDLSQPAGLTGVARDEAHRRELQLKANKLDTENRILRKKIQELSKEKVSKKKKK